MEMKIKTIQGLCEFIWYLEEKYDLLELDVEGVKVWQYHRMKIYYLLAEKLDIFSQPHSELTAKGKLKSVFIYIKNSFRDNLFTLKKVDIIIFSHPRVSSVDGKFIDIYTKYLIDELNINNKVLEFEGPYLGVHKKQRERFAHYIDWIAILQRIYKIFIKTNIAHKECKTLTCVEGEIKATCNIEIDLEIFFKSTLKTYKALYTIYDKIFIKTKPHSFYTVVSYGQAPIIKAAKDNGVEVIELQHGIFSDYHLGYSFPHRPKYLEYFPDKFYVWSGMWKKAITFPINEKKIIIDKFRYLESEKTKYANLKKENQIIVLSQGAIGNNIAEAILNNFNKFKRYNIKYKLHPGEFDRWEGYPALQKLSKFSNVTILKDEVHLYKLFSTSQIQVGVFSTALYEGVEFGCKTVLLDLPGIEYMNNFIDIVDDVEVLRW
jgi:hypothetical protein